MEVADQRRSHPRSRAICSDVFAEHAFYNHGQEHSEQHVHLSLIAERTWKTKGKSKKVKGKSSV